jgi:hypothetical protein
VWEGLQHEHGGGPLVQTLEVCKDCKVGGGRGRWEGLQHEHGGVCKDCKVGGALEGGRGGWVGGREVAVRV